MAAEMLARLEPIAAGGGRAALELGRRQAYEQMRGEQVLLAQGARAKLADKLESRPPRLTGGVEGGLCLGCGWSGIGWRRSWRRSTRSS